MFQADLFAGQTAGIAGGSSGITPEIARNLAR
jgi:short-subunit dehydrogenase